MVIVRWAIGLLVLFVFALFAFVVWLALNEDVVTEDGAPPLITAEGLPYKEQPAERGGIAVMNEDSSLVQALDRGPDEAVVERILPAPETPPRSAAEIRPQPTDEAAGEEPPVAASEPPASEGVLASDAPVNTTPEPIVPPTVEALSSTEPDQTVNPVAPILAELEPPAPVADAAPSAVPPVSAPSNLPQVIAGPAPAGTGAVITFDNPATSPATAPPVAAQPITPPANVTPPTAAPVLTAPRTDSYRVQLSALRDEAQAQRAWGQLQARFPDILDGEVFIVPSETDRGLFYRVQAGLYGSRADANAACEALKGQGGDCFVVRGQN